MDIILERDQKEKIINYKIDIKSLSTSSTKKNHQAWSGLYGVDKPTMLEPEIMDKISSDIQYFFSRWKC